MHCIQVFITKDDGSFGETPHMKLPQNFVLFTEKPKGLKKGRLVAYCQTDYFGGCGEQSATVWENKEKIFHKEKYPSINEALKILGVSHNKNADEFDTINLGLFRTNQDIENEI